MYILAVPIKEAVISGECAFLSDLHVFRPCRKLQLLESAGISYQPLNRQRHVAGLYVP